jgi:hypothetical protein
LKVKDLITLLESHDPEKEIFIVESIGATFITEQITLEEEKMNGDEVLVLK